MTDSRPELAALRIADPPERWRALGFDVDHDCLGVGGITIELGVGGSGITGWTLRNLERQPEEIDGLPTRVAAAAPPPPAAHPNGVTGIDHVVILSPDFDRTATALANAGLALRRVTDSGGFRQGFRRLGPAILELVQAPPQDRDRPLSFWGLTFVAADLVALAERLGDRLGPIRPAVQPGRQIATLHMSAGLSTRVAFMDPE